MDAHPRDITPPTVGARFHFPVEEGDQIDDHLPKRYVLLAGDVDDVSRIVLASLPSTDHAAIQATITPAGDADALQPGYYPFTLAGHRFQVVLAREEQVDTGYGYAQEGNLESGVIHEYEFLVGMQRENEDFHVDEEVPPADVQELPDNDHSEGLPWTHNVRLWIDDQMICNSPIALATENPVEMIILERDSD